MNFSGSPAGRMTKPIPDINGNLFAQKPDLVTTTILSRLGSDYTRPVSVKSLLPVSVPSRNPKCLPNSPQTPAITR